MTNHYSDFYFSLYSNFLPFLSGFLLSTYLHCLERVCMGIYPFLFPVHLFLSGGIGRTGRLGDFTRFRRHFLGVLGLASLQSSLLFPFLFFCLIILAFSLCKTMDPFSSLSSGSCSFCFLPYIVHARLYYVLSTHNPVEHWV